MKPLFLACALSLGSCAPVPADAPQSPAGSTECGIVGSSDWAAWVNAMPGPNARPKLIVTGKVSLPSGASRVGWRDMRVMESYPVQIAVDIQAVEPREVAGTPVVVIHDVRGEWPIDPPVGALSIHCGDRVLARISPVETAH